MRDRAASLPWASAALVFVLVTSTAHAQDDAEPAGYREAIAAAVAELNAGRFEEALAQFTRAHELVPSARTLRGIGLAAFELRDYVRALEALEGSLADPRRPLTEAQRDEVGGLAARALQYIGRLRVEVAPDDAAITVDGADVAPDAEGWLRLNAGDHQVVARAADHRDATRRVTLHAGEQQTLSITLEAAEPTPDPSGTTDEPHADRPTDPPPAGPGLDPGAIALTTLGGVLILGAGGFAVVTGLQQGEVDGCTAAIDDGDLATGCANPADVSGARDAWLGVTIGAGVAGVALLVAGAVLLGTGGDEERAELPCRPAGAGMACRF
ncbi:MAG: PEGA domain-containing protein [Myxococcales bacterium]|nr:PEGA domain-containing protein [Myxococcales bacterium]